MNMNELCGKHAPYRKLSQYKLKLKTKPWITPAMQKLILIKANLFKKYIKLSDPLIKQEVHLKYKCYRNLLLTIFKNSKQIYYEKFFQNNLNDIKNIWKGIRNLVSLKQSTKSNIHLLSHNNETITAHKNIANMFIDYFSTIAEKQRPKLNSQINISQIFSIPLLIIHFSLWLQTVIKSKI